MTTLRNAAQAFIDSWDSGHFFTDSHAERIAALRAALDEPDDMEIACREGWRYADELKQANTKLVGAIDLIRETLNGGEVQDLHQIINAALAEYRHTDKPTEAQMLGGDLWGGGRF